jgi:hypothetical protein
MAYKPETPFDSIEGAHEYVGLLDAAVAEARGAIEEDIGLTQGEGAPRRREALQLVTYKLDRLNHHLAATRRLLNDLRTLRRLLLSERDETLESASPAPPESDPAPRRPASAPSRSRSERALLGL